MDIDALRNAHPEHWMKAACIRTLTLDAVAAANSGHSGAPMGMADVATVLFEKHLKFDASAPNWPDRDRFILSAGHGSMLVYSLLYLTGDAQITLEEVKNFRQLGARTAGHPENFLADGIETTTGPLGQGISNAVGFAIAEESQRAHWGKKVVDHYTYCIAGDGCLMEGVSQEAIALAGHLKLSRLIVMWDNNDITIDGKVSLSDSTDQVERFKASGWNVLQCDGHDPEAIDAALTEAKKSDRPTMIACKTHIALGHAAQDTSKGHGALTDADQLDAAKKAYGWTSPAFTIPADLKSDWEAIGSRGEQDRKDWEVRLGALSERKPADLGVFSAEDRKGRFIHYGIREHGMAAAMNGMALHGGSKPYSGTFMCFTDYARPAMRLSALMKVAPVYVMTHDSIGLGEDGPTHQPVEHLALLRATPNTLVFRPADAVETAEAWEIALSQTSKPSILALSRQGLPTVRKEHKGKNLTEQGAYVLADAEGKRQAILLATGSEVSIAMEAKALLEAEGIGTRVVSMPSMELFAAQDEKYRKRVLPGGPVRVAVEAAVRQGWDQWLLGERGREAKAGFVGMDSFGASAPAEELYEKFGITAKAVAEKVKSLL